VKAGETIEKDAPAIERKPVATVAPLRFDEEWRTRDVTLLDPLAAAVFEPFARLTEQAEIVILHREHAEQVVMLPWTSWLRLAATIAAANGEPAGLGTAG
jgi:hypothetical protein